MTLAVIVLSLAMLTACKHFESDRPHRKPGIATVKETACISSGCVELDELAEPVF